MRRLLLCFVVLIATTTHAQKFRFGKVSEEELREKVHPLDSSANAAILYRETTTRFEHEEGRGFYLITDFVERIKIYNKDGFNWATREIRTYNSDKSKESISGLKAYTYYLDEKGNVEDSKVKGSGIFEEQVSKYRKVTKIAFPNVTEGCVIEYKYSLSSPFIDNIDEYRFQESIPVNKVKLVFKTPEYFYYKTHQKGWMPIRIEQDARPRNMQYAYRESAIDNPSNVTDKIVRTTVDFTENISRVELSNIPALVDEKYSGNIDNYSSSLKFELSYTQFPGATIENYSKTWESVSETINKSQAFGQEIKRTRYFEDDLAGVLSGVSGTNEKMIAIYEFVKGKMNWNQYTGYYVDKGVKSAYKEGTGNTADINLMLVGMLRKAGLKANPVLVSTISHGIPLFPTRNGFNYVIAGVETDNGIVLLDATYKGGEANMLRPNLLNWQGRMIRPNHTSTWVSLTPRKHAVKSTMVNASITPDQSFEGINKSSYTGHFAMEYRSELSNMSEEDTRDHLQQGLGDTELSNIETENLKKLYKAVSLKYDFECFDHIEEVDGKLYFSPMMYMAIDENPFKLSERNYPINFIFPRKDRYIISVEIPEGYQVEALPQPLNASLSEGIGNFRYNISHVGQKVQLSVELSLNHSLVGPQFYGDLKAFYQMVIEKQNEKVVLTKT